MTEGFNALDKSAILLLSLGEEGAAEVLKHLAPKEVQRIGNSMAALTSINRTQIENVLNNFFTDAQEQTSVGVGSDDYIRKMLVNALGEEKAGGLADRILMGGNTSGLDTLKWMDSRSVSDIIRFEHPQIQAIVLAYLDPDQAAAILMNLDERVRLDIIMRICEIDSIQPQALKELNDILERQFSSSAGSSSTKLGGVKSTADIMNFLDTTVETSLIDLIKESNEELAQEIQDLMFVFDNLADVDNQGIQALLREISTEILILALKGADDTVKEKIFSNMSKRAADLLRDDLESKGPVRVSDVEAAQKEILSIARRLAESGDIVLGGKGGEDMI